MNRGELRPDRAAGDLQMGAESGWDQLRDELGDRGGKLTWSEVKPGDFPEFRGGEAENEAKNEANSERREQERSHEKEPVPEVLYRGVGLTYEQALEFSYEGVEMRPPHPPEIDEQGRETVGDGNEYGVYMSDNLSMVQTAYGDAERQGTAIDRELRLGARRQPVELPGVGVIWQIQTEGLPDVHKPWISNAMSGHYNNGFAGDEWIAEKIPAENYRLLQVQVAQDMLHDEQKIEVESGATGEVTEAVKGELEERKARLELFTEQMKERLSPMQQRTFTSDDFLAMKKIFGKEGAWYAEDADFNITKQDEATKALLKQEYSREEKLSLRNLSYIVHLEQGTEDVAGMVEQIQGDIAETERKKQEFARRKQAEGEKDYNTNGFDTKIEFYESLLARLGVKQQKEPTEMSKTELAAEYLECLEKLSANFTSPEGKAGGVVNAEGRAIGNQYSGGNTEEFLRIVERKRNFERLDDEKGVLGQKLRYDLADNLLRDDISWESDGEPVIKARAEKEAAEKALEAFNQQGWLKKLMRRREKRELEQKLGEAARQQRLADAAAVRVRQSLAQNLINAYSEDAHYGHHQENFGVSQAEKEARNEKYNELFFGGDQERQELLARAKELRKELLKKSRAEMRPGDKVWY